MTRDEERWAEALLIEKMRGADAPRFVAERIGAMVAGGDEAGLTRWREIAARLDQLLKGPAATC